MSQIAYFTGASQRAPHIVKFDFFHMHCVNSSIFFPFFLKSSSLSTAAKIRLLEWKARTDLVLYTSRGAPALDLNEIRNYTPKHPAPAGTDPWPAIIARVCALGDDGHSSKLVRALANGKKVSAQFEENRRDAFVIKGDMWDQLGYMVIDSVEAGEPYWVRSAGFDEAWENIPTRDGARL
jgi:hypothetical protein